MCRGRRPIGIAERRGRTLTMVLAFVRQPQYRVRFQFHEVVRRVAEDDARLEANIEAGPGESAALNRWRVAWPGGQGWFNPSRQWPPAGGVTRKRGSDVLLESTGGP